MTDLEKIELAARRNAEAIHKSVWLPERERSFLGNAFDAFADEIANIGKEAKPFDAFRLRAPGTKQVL